MKITSKKDLANYIISRLNDIVETDPQAIECLISNRVPCNKAMVEHPTVQTCLELDRSTTVGLLGLLNGIVNKTFDVGFGKGFGLIAASYDKDEKLIRFCRCKSKMDVESEGFRNQK